MDRSDLDLPAIRARADAATPGPWEWWPTDPIPLFRIGVEAGPRIAEVAGPTERGADAEFIAAARTDVPALLDEVEELRALFDTQYQRMSEATGRWRAEDPDSRALVMPDLGVLLRWLMDSADTARAEVGRLKTFESTYNAAQKVLDEILGTEEEDGAGEGLCADMRLVGTQRDEARAQVRSRDAALDVVRSERDEMVVTSNRFEGKLDEARAEVARLRALADDIRGFRDAYRDDLDRAEKDLDELRSRLDRAEGETTRLREDLADAKHECEVLREGAADLDERLQLALKDEGRARADYDAAALLLGRALVERDGYRAQAARLRSELAEVTGQRNDAVDLAITLTSTDGQVA